MAQEELRHRRVYTDTNRLVDSRQATMPSRSIEDGLTAPKLLDASPQHHGYVMKLHVSPFFYTLLPQWLQRWIASIWLFAWLAPSWEKRYLVLLGSFLYKFVDKNHPRKGPKGSPFDLQATQVELVVGADDHDMAVALSQIPPNMCVFSVSTLRKTHFYAVSDRNQAEMWLTALRQSRQEAITRSMGHAPADSYPQSWDYYDSLGKSLIKSKDRIRERMQATSLRELEMSHLGEGGGSLPRGYFG